MSNSAPLRGLCWCDEHLAGAPWRINEHVYVLLKRTTYDESGEKELWAWECSCSSIAGHRWTDEGANKAYHNWLFHVEKRGGRR